MQNKVANFDNLYEKYHSLVYKLSYLMTQNKADSEDILQELFIKLCYKSPCFCDEIYEKAWVIRVTQNLCKNYHKKASNRYEVPSKMIEDNGTFDKTDETLKTIIALSTTYKTVLLLYYYIGYKIDEIAIIMHTTPNAVKTRLMRGRQRLKIELEETENEK